MSDAFEAGLAALRADRSRGASALARFALGLLADAARETPARDPAELRARLADCADRLARARPSMAPIANLVAAWSGRLAALPAAELGPFRRAAARVAEDLAEESRRAVGAAAAHAAVRIGPGATILCHSLSSTVLAVFDRLAGRRVRLIQTESRPLYEGRAAARHAAGLGLDVVLISDAQVGLTAAEADLALVGADALMPDGAVVNKAGTLPLALAARAAGIPFQVCCERFKVRPAAWGPAELEAMDPAELGTPDLGPATVRNVYFDLTPADLVAAWITEAGFSETPPKL